MPLIKIDKTATRCWGLWRISEEEADLENMISPHECIPDNIRFPKKRLEFAAGRALAKAMLDQLNVPFRGIEKDIYGKPLLKGSGFNISLSHSFPHVGVIIDQYNEVGIDVEQPTPKLLRIGGRVLHPRELADAGSDVTKHCIYWCAKETLVKIYGRKDLHFSENLLIDSFLSGNEGDLSGTILTQEFHKQVPMHYHIYDDFVVVYNK